MGSLYNIITILVDLLARKIGLALIYYSRVGIKPINQIISSNNFEAMVDKKAFFVNTERLLLPNDGLKDENTLLGTNLMNSPHLELMKVLDEKGNIKNTSYIKRMEGGKLDFRKPIKLTKRLERRMVDTFSQKKQLIQNDEYRPIKVAKVNGEYYILDGKHTAALCALLNKKNVECVDITPIIYDSYSKWIYLRMLKKENFYKKHIHFYKYIWG